jgi:hypothetical protein
MLPPPPAVQNPMSASTNTLKLTNTSESNTGHLFQLSGSKENLPPPPLDISKPEEDSYGDIVHYKMASMNINNANYINHNRIIQAQVENAEPQIHQSIFNVRLEPNGGPLGITLAGSEDLSKPIKISGLAEGGIAQNTGQLRVGDCLLAINGESVRGLPLSTATKLLHKFENVVDMQVSRSENYSNGKSQTNGDPQPQAVYAKVQRRPRSPSVTDAISTNSNSSGNYRTFHVTLFKDRVYDDYGFSVSDGLYERGVYINRIRSGGPADLVRLLKPFDRIIQVTIFEFSKSLTVLGCQTFRIFEHDAEIVVLLPHSFFIQRSNILTDSNPDRVLMYKEKSSLEN